METGEAKQYEGHKSWVYCLEIMGERLFSGSDDKTIIVWNIATTKIQEQLIGHDNAISSIIFAYGDLYSASYDHFILCWNLEDMEERIEEKEEMRAADITSRKFETYWRLLEAKKGKKKKGKGGAKKGPAKKKK